MDSLFATLYLAIAERIKEGLTDNECANVDIDLGQMEGYNPENGGRPKIHLPAHLVDFESTNFTDEGAAVQRAETVILIRSCFEQVSPTDKLTPDEWREKGLAYFDIEWKLHKLLHDWSPGDGFGYLTRMSAVTEARPDHYRVRAQRYKLSFTDNSTLREIGMASAPPVVTPKTIS